MFHCIASMDNTAAYNNVEIMSFAPFTTCMALYFDIASHYDVTVSVAMCKQ